jgi:hypothetical protein
MVEPGLDDFDENESVRSTLSADSASGLAAQENQTTTGIDNQAAQVLGDGNFITQAENIYVTLASSVSAPAAEITFEPWTRKSKLYDCLKDEFGEKLEHAKERICSDHIVILGTTLPSVAVDLFQRICNNSDLFNRQFEVTWAGDYDDVSLADIFTALSKLGKGDIFYLDLHSFPSDAQNSLSSKLNSDIQWLIRSLIKSDVYCVAALPASSLEANTQLTQSVTFSYDEEELILVNRASVRGDRVQSVIADKLKEQIAHSLWGERMTRLHLLDDLIRAEKVEERFDQYARQLHQVDSESRKYEARLADLIGVRECEVAENDPYRTLRQTWSRPATSSIIERALFVLTTFDQVSARDFDFLMNEMLNGETAVELLKEVAQSAEPTADGLQQTMAPIERTISLKSLYATRPDNILALLDVRAQEYGALNFEPAFKLKVARDFFHSQRPIQAGDFLIRQTLDRLMLFNAPIHIAEQLADRYVEYASRLGSIEQRVFVSLCFDHLTRGFIDEQFPSFGENNRNSGIPALKLLFQAFAHSPRDRTQALLKAYAERACLLLNRLLSGAATKDLVDHALNRIMDEGDGSDKFDLVLKLVRNLRRHKDFDTLRWLKRLLAQGDDDAKRSALEFLAGGIERGSDEERAVLIESLRSWVPTADKAAFLNNQTAALLAPRVAMHRAFARTKDRDHGKVDQLAPLFDLGREQGVTPEFFAAIDLLTVPVDGPWIGIDLDFLEHLVDARWGLDGLPNSLSIQSAYSIGKRRMGLFILDERFSGQSLTEADTRQFVLVALFVEAVAMLLGNPSTADPKRMNVMKLSFERIGSRLSRDALYSSYRCAYRFAERLKEATSASAQRRSRCARWLGEVLYQLYKGA